MTLILLLIILFLVFGGSGAWYGRRAGWGAPRYGGGLVGLLVLLLIVWAVFTVLDTPPMPAGTAPISRPP